MRLSETKSRLNDTRNQFLSEIVSLNDEYEKKKREREELENEMKALHDENSSKMEDYRKRLNEVQNILHETEAIKQKIVDILSAVKQDLYRKIRNDIEGEYDFILIQIQSFTEDISLRNSIGVFEAMFASDSAKRKLAEEVGEKLRDFFDKELRE